MSRPIVTVESGLPIDLVPFLSRITFGSDGLRYRRLDVGDQLANLRSPVCLSARVGGELIGAYLLDRRELDFDGRPVQALYRGSLAVDEAWRGQGLGRQLCRTAFDWIGAEGSPWSWGCIERDNRRSLGVLKDCGAEPVVGLQRLMLYRQWPRERLELELMLGGHAEDTDGHASASGPVHEQLVDSTHADCRLRDRGTGNAPRFGVVDEQGPVVCARVSVHRWHLQAMGPWLEWIDRWLVRPWPVARRRFDSRCFVCLSFSEIGLRDGSEASWPLFVSSVMARHQAHFAMLTLDSRSRLYRRLGGRRRQVPDLWIVAGYRVDRSIASAVRHYPVGLAPAELG